MNRTLTICWQEHNGIGLLMATDDEGSTIGQVEHADPINAGTDSDQIAAIVCQAIGARPVNVTHDRDTIFVEIAD